MTKIFELVKDPYERKARVIPRLLVEFYTTLSGGRRPAGADAMILHGSSLTHWVTF